VLRAQHVEHLLLVRVVRVGVQEADADRSDPGVLEEPGGGDGVVPVEGTDLGAGDGQPPADGADQVGRDDPWRLDPEVAVAVASTDS
jgi:hypothetical protein